MDCPNGFLPNDIILQILARLPIKSLFRCKSVCKYWCRLPSEKHFVHLYYKTSSNNPIVLIEILESVQITAGFICLDRFSGFAEFSLGFLNDRVKVRAACNGLLCCSSVSNRGLYYVCNPITREFRLLPKTRDTPITRFHPDDEATLVGLAFDPSTWKFNVALAGSYRPFGHRPHDQFVCRVFDSETNAWRRFVSSQYDEFNHINRNQVVFSCGSLHWLTQNSSYILVLDLRYEVWKKIPLPDEIVTGEFGSRMCLLDLEGSVSVIQISGVWMNTWVLKDYEGEQWDLVDRVHLRCIKGFSANVFPISQSRDVVFLATQKKVLTYGRKDKVWKEIYGVEDSSTFPLWFYAHAFRNTLFSCH